MGSDSFSQLKAYYRNLLPSLSDEGWSICEQVSEVKVYRKGDFLMRDGEVCDHVSFITKGLVRFYYIAEEGREKTICFMNDGMYVSDYTSFLTRQPSFQYIQALEDTEVVSTDYDSLQRLYREVPEANLIGRLIAEEMFIRINEINILTSKETIEQRYRRLIDEQPWLLQKVPQYMIASYLNVTPEALSRTKARMNKSKKVEEVVY